MYEKFKLLISNETFFLAILLVLVAIISFGLGRNSVVSFVNTAQDQAGVIFHESEAMDDVHDDGVMIQVVASKTGSKYHLPDCPGATRIKDENKLYFDSYELAEAAGYTQAANCNGF